MATFRRRFPYLWRLHLHLAIPALVLVWLAAYVATPFIVSADFTSLWDLPSRVGRYAIAVVALVALLLGFWTHELLGYPISAGRKARAFAAFVVYLIVVAGAFYVPAALLHGALLGVAERPYAPGAQRDLTSLGALCVEVPDETPPDGGDEAAPDGAGETPPDEVAETPVDPTETAPDEVAEIFERRNVPLDRTLHRYALHEWLPGDYRVAVGGVETSVPSSWSGALGQLCPWWRQAEYFYGRGVEVWLPANPDPALELIGGLQTIVTAQNLRAGAASPFGIYAPRGPITALFYLFCAALVFALSEAIGRDVIRFSAIYERMGRLVPNLKWSWYADRVLAHVPWWWTVGFHRVLSDLLVATAIGVAFGVHWRIASAEPFSPEEQRIMTIGLFVVASFFIAREPRTIVRFRSILRTFALSTTAAVYTFVLAFAVLAGFGAVEILAPVGVGVLEAADRVYEYGISGWVIKDFVKILMLVCALPVVLRQIVLSDRVPMLVGFLIGVAAAVTAGMGLSAVGANDWRLEIFFALCMGQHLFPGRGPWRIGVSTGLFACAICWFTWLMFMRLNLYSADFPKSDDFFERAAAVLAVLLIWSANLRRLTVALDRPR